MGVKRVYCAFHFVNQRKGTRKNIYIKETMGQTLIRNERKNYERLLKLYTHSIALI